MLEVFLLSLPLFFLAFILLCFVMFVLYNILTQTSLQIAVSITEEYIILGGSEFLSIHASSVAQILDLVVGNVNDRGLLSTLPVIDILIQVLIKTCK